MKHLYLLLSMMLFVYTANAQTVSTAGGNKDEAVQVESVSESTDGTFNFKSFEVEVPQAASYYMEMWVLPSRMADDTFSSLFVYLNNAYIGTVKPIAANWQSASLAETETLDLPQGTNVITVATIAPETPGVETIKLAINKAAASFSSEAYTKYLEDAIDGKFYKTNYNEEETSAVSTCSTAASPAYYANVDLKYSFWKTFTFTKDQEIFITSSSETEHKIDVQFHGTDNTIAPMIPSVSSTALNNSAIADSLFPKYWFSYTYATSAEMQGPNWSGSSIKASNSTKQVATVRITIPKTGMYMVRMRSTENGVLSVVDLNVNGVYYYEDAPIYLSYVDCVIPADGVEYAVMTNCYNSDTDNPMIFIHGADADRIVGYNNNGPFEKLNEYGLSSKDAYIAQTYFMPTEGISVSSYSSSNPDSKCSIYARVANEDTESAAKAMKSMSSSTTAINSVKDGKGIMPSISAQENVLKISSANKIKSVTVYNTAGSALAHFAYNGNNVSVPTSSFNATGSGLYIICIETEGGVSSRKIIVR